MSPLRAARAGLRRLFRKQVVDHELDDELRHYLELATQDKMREGMSRDAAERAARLEIGGIEQTKERVRAGGWEAGLETLWQDLTYALRGLRASPGYALAAIATLGVAIAITTTLLTVSNTVLHQEWAVREPSRMFMLVTARGGPRFSPAEARYLNERATTFSGIIAARCLSSMRDECDLSVSDALTPVDFVSGNYFDVLALPLSVGRGFTPGEDQLANPIAVAVISEALWHARFGSDPRIVGTSLRIGDARFTIIGVAPRDFTGTRTERKDVWLPLASMQLVQTQSDEARVQLTNPSGDVSEAAVAGRLANGATPAKALAELGVLDRQYRQDNRLEDLGVKLIPTTYFPNPAKLRTAEGALSMMFVAVVLVLMLACANVGNLLLARAMARGREIAVRLALGASRARVVRQLITESLLLSIAAGVVGISASLSLPSLIMTRAFGRISWTFAPDANVLAAATVIVALTCIAFGLAPSLHATRSDVANVLKSGTAASRGASGRTMRGTLLATQVAVSLLLLVNAGQIGNAIRRAHDANPGFAAHGVGVLTVELPSGLDSARRVAFASQLVHDSRNVDGIAVAFANATPFGATRLGYFRLPGDAATRTRVSGAFDISPGFFTLLGLPIVEGRGFEATDGDDVALVNQSLASSLWPGENPLGQVLNDGVARRVVGVVKDARLYRLGNVDGALFRPLRVGSPPTVFTRPVTPATTQALAAIVSRIEPRAVIHIDSIAGNVDRQLGGLKVIASLAGILGLVAVILASIGVFGVFAYVVQQRTREIGIRAALGASWRNVTMVVLHDSARSVLSGLGIGLVLSIAVSRVVQSELYGATPFDWRTLGALVVLLTLAGAAATFVPARRAALVDPVVALRTD